MVDDAHGAASAALGTHPASLHLTPLPLGIPRVDIACPPKSSAAIADFYSTLFQAPTTTDDGLCTVLIAGGFQEVRFIETPAEKLTDGTKFGLKLREI